MKGNGYVYGYLEPELIKSAELSKIMKELYQPLIPTPPNPLDLRPQVPPLVAEPQLVEPPKSNRLFKMVLNNEPAHLLNAVRHDPKEFDDGVEKVLSGLYTGGVKFDDLTVADLDLLDEATLHFATTNWESKKTAGSLHPRTPRSFKKSIEMPVEAPRMSEQHLPDFWWLG